MRSLAFNPNNEELASAGWDFTIRCWWLKDDTAKELRNHTRTVRSIAYLTPKSACIRRPMTANLFVWNLADNELLQTFGPFPEGVQSVAASPKGTFLFAGLGNGRIHVLDPIEKQTRACSIGGTEAVSAVAVSQAVAKSPLPASTARFVFGRLPRSRLCLP